MLGTVLSALASFNFSVFVRRIRNAAVVYAIVAIAALTGCGFLIGTGYIAASARWGPLRASLAFGGGFIVRAIVVFAIHQIASALAERRRAREQRAAQLSSLVAAAVALLPTLLRSKAGLAELLAPVVALIAYLIYKENSDDGGGAQDGDDTAA